MESQRQVAAWVGPESLLLIEACAYSGLAHFASTLYVVKEANSCIALTRHSTEYTNSSLRSVWAGK